jgi:hypothetical protein
MSGQVYELPVWDTITTAWDKAYGAKKTFWASIAVLFVIVFTIGVAQGLTDSGADEKNFISIIIGTIGNIVAYFLQLGLIYMGINRAIDRPIHYKMLFRTFNLPLALNIVGLYTLQVLLFLAPVVIAALGVFLISGPSTVLGVLLCVVAFIAFAILMVRLSLCMAYILDANSTPLTSIKQSIRATTGNFWNLVAVFLIQFLIILVSIIPFGLGLIWTLPFGFICYGTVYQRLRTNL